MSRERASKKAQQIEEMQRKEVLKKEKNWQENCIKIKVREKQKKEELGKATS